MEIKLILTAYFVNFGLRIVGGLNQIKDQEVISKKYDGNKIRDNFQNLFDSIAKNDSQKRESYREVLEEEIAKNRETFYEIQVEMQMMQNRNSYRNKYFDEYKKHNASRNVVAVKRETTENNNDTTQSTKHTFTTTDDPYIPPNKTSVYHQLLLDEFVQAFSENDTAKKEVLLSTNSTESPRTSDCYIAIFDTFKAHCLYYYYQLQTVDAFKILFRRICGTKWLETESIAKMIKKTCAQNPYLQH